MITLKNLKKQYGERTVLSIDELTLEKGKTYALIGANGSGKSTLLKAVAGVIDFLGEANLNGGKTAYMPQSSFCFSLSVLKNVTLACPWLSDKENSKKKAEEMLRLFGLYHLKNKAANKLSGGETQRLALARLLMTDCDTLLLDEPTASMDAASIKICEQALKQYILQKKGTMIIATHSLAEAKRLADEVIFLSDGNVIEKGDVADVLERPNDVKTKQFLENF